MIYVLMKKQRTLFKGELINQNYCSWIIAPNIIMPDKDEKVIDLSKIHADKTLLVSNT